jgi:DNA-binding transcriptional LysR family regulator
MAMPVDVRGLRCFLAVVAAGSVSRAAQLLHLAQPALSLQIRHLEETLGVTLFNRSHKGVTPTAAGLRLENHAREILKRLDIACEDVRDQTANPEGRVAIGLPQSMAKILVVPLVREALRRWPRVRLQIIELSTGYIPNHVLSGHLDMGLTFQARTGSGLLFEHMGDEELVLVAQPGRLGAGGQPRRTVRLRGLRRYPMILPAREHSLRTLIDGHMRTHGVELAVLAEVNAISELIALAAAGVGCSILSYAAIQAELRHGSLSAARITHPAMSRPVYLCRSASLPQSTAASVVQGLLTEILGVQIANACSAMPCILDSAAKL